MSDWQGQVIQPPVIGSMSSHSGQASATYCYGSVTITNQTWQAANRALYWPVEVQSACTAYQIAFQVGTQSGNCDVGIYDEQGKRLVSSGSTAVAAAGVQVIDIADTLLIPGVYFLAMNVDNTTAAFQIGSIFSIAQLQSLGMQIQNLASVTLPDPATFANPSASFPTAELFVSTFETVI